MIFIRQKMILSLLKQAGHPLPRTVLVKLAFLLRQETVVKEESSFYDFVPYKYGPFSFTLYRELGNLQQYGYLASGESSIALSESAPDLAIDMTTRLPKSIQSAIADVLGRYGKLSQEALVQSVYTRYPWYALNSELPERRLISIQRPKKSAPAVYTTGYEGRSVDAFFNDLMERGIEVVIDVRANPVSRKYGFSRLRLGDLCERLGFEYRHMPNLGIPSVARAGLSDFDSYQRLLNQYEQTMLPEHPADIEELGRILCRRSSVLVCVEKDVRCCHRSRLANAVAAATGLEVVHL